MITINHDWRTIYQVAAALVGFVFLVAFFTFPETAYIRDSASTQEDDDIPAMPSGRTSGQEADTQRGVSLQAPPPSKKSYLVSLRIFHGTLTEESFVKLALRPLGLILLPPVLWAALVEAVTIGFLVAVSSNVDLAFSMTYGFESWQVGLCFVAAIIGSLIAIPAGGHLGDSVADWFTKRSGGIRDPEMRLPTMILSLITTPLGLILYGVGIEYQLHWICPTIGLGLRKRLSSSRPSPRLRGSNMI